MKIDGDQSDNAKHIQNLKKEKGNEVYLVDFDINLIENITKIVKENCYLISSEV